MDGLEDSYPKKHIREQLKLHLGKRLKFWAAGRTRVWKGILLHIGIDFVEIGQIRREETWGRQYILLDNIVLIEPLE